MEQIARSVRNFSIRMQEGTKKLLSLPSSLPVLFSAVLVILYVVFLNPHIDVKDFNQHDPAFYINRAISMLNGSGYGELFANRFLPVTIQPPGFSVLLMPVIALFGVNFIALKLFMVFLAGILGVCAYCFFRYFLGGQDYAVMATWFLMASPIIFGLSHRVMADIPLFIFVTLGLLSLDRYLRSESTLWSPWLLAACLTTVLAYFFKATALGLFAGGWFLLFHPKFWNKSAFFKLLVFTVICWMPIGMWNRWCASIPDVWYWTHSSKDFLLREPFEAGTSLLSLADFLVRVRRNFVYGMSNNLAIVFLAPLYFTKGELIGFVMSFPLFVFLCWQWVKSFRSTPSVLEGFVLFSVAFLLIKYHGFADRYAALIYPALLVYGFRCIASWTRKAVVYGGQTLLAASLGVTLWVGIDQWKDPYGSQVMNDFVAMANQSKRLISNDYKCVAPLNSHWQVLTGHWCLRSEPGHLLNDLQSEPHAYVVGLSDGGIGAYQELKGGKKVRFVDQNILENGVALAEVTERNPNFFKKVYENDTFALFKTKPE